MARRGRPFSMGSSSRICPSSLITASMVRMILDLSRLYRIAGFGSIGITALALSRERRESQLPLSRERGAPLVGLQRLVMRPYGRGAMFPVASRFFALSHACRSSSWCNAAHSATKLNALGRNRPAMTARVSMLITASSSDTPRENAKDRDRRNTF